jgi:hypothetical protein
MSIFEKKLARFREKQEREKARENAHNIKRIMAWTKEEKRRIRKIMNNPELQDKVIKSLEEQIAATKDPKIKADLTRQLTKLATYKPTARYLKRDDKVTSSRSSILDKITGTMVDDLPDGERVMHHLVLHIEAQCKGRGGWNALTRAEKDVLLAEATKTLSERDRAAYEALGTEGVA